MRPDFSQPNHGHECLSDSVPCRDLSLRDAIDRSDGENLRVGEFRQWMPLSSYGDPSLPAFGEHIGRVVRFRSDEQVIWPDAWWIIATVEDAEFSANRAEHRFIGVAVGVDMPTVNCQCAVAGSGATAVPFPASIGSFHAGQESQRRIIWEHRRSTPSVSGPRLVAQCGGRVMLEMVPR